MLKGGDGRQVGKPAAQIRLVRADMMVRTAEASLRNVARCLGAVGELD